MQEVLPRILPQNRNSVAWYFVHQLPHALAMTAGFRTLTDERLEGRFQDYIKHEEDRIRGNLEKIKYNIDTPETVSLVVGSGGLEKVGKNTSARELLAADTHTALDQSCLVVLCLLLEHDLRLVRAATRIIILEQIQITAQTTIWHLFNALYNRYNELKSRGIYSCGNSVLRFPRANRRT